MRLAINASKNEYTSFRKQNRGFIQDSDINGETIMVNQTPLM